MVVRPKIYGRGNQRSKADRDADDRAAQLASMTKASSANRRYQKVTLPRISIQDDNDADSEPDSGGR